jgi:phosphoglycolate phosphatase
MSPRTTEPAYLESFLGIVFDLDGTLVLSRHDFRRMRAEVIRIAERHGVVPGHLSLDQPIHRLVEAAREDLRVAGVPDGELWRFEAEYNRTIDAIEMEALPRTVARAGASSLLAELVRRGFRTGLLTRSSETFARSALRATGLDGYFAYLRTRSSPGPAKPSPEALLHLLHEMGVPLDRALYVGDHLIDAECAARSQVRFYAVLPDPAEGRAAETSADRFVAAGASAVVPDLPELARRLGLLKPATAA